ncbi:MAG: helix-turn-helix domain-containing protein [Pyrinomonadaceae bacterium]
MFSRNKPNEAYFTRQVWQQVTTPRIGILHELANKLLSEVENITAPGRLQFGDGFKLSDQIQKFETDMIRHALYLTNGKQSDAARMLGIKLTTLNAKIKRFELDPTNSDGRQALQG